MYPCIAVVWIRTDPLASLNHALIAKEIGKAAPHVTANRSLVRREIEFPIFPGFGSLWIVGGSDEYVVHLIDMETARLVGDRQIALAQAGFFQHVGANGGIA